jgi:hypothetical protein
VTSRWGNARRRHGEHPHGGRGSSAGAATLAGVSDHRDLGLQVTHDASGKGEEAEEVGQQGGADGGDNSVEAGGGGGVDRGGGGGATKHDVGREARSSVQEAIDSSQCVSLPCRSHSSV